MKYEIKHTLQFYLKHVRKFKYLALASFLGTVLGVITSMLSPFFMKMIIDEMSVATNLENTLPYLLWFLAAVITTDIFGNIAWRTVGYSICALQPKVMMNVMNECFNTLHKHSFGFFNDNFTGSLVKKVNRFVLAFEGISDLIIYDFLPIFIRSTIAISVLFYLNWLLGLSLLLWTLLFIGGNYIFAMYKLKHYDIPKVKTDSKLNAQLADSITNHGNIKLFANQELESQSFRQISRNWQEKTIKSWFFSQHVELLQSITMTILNFFILFTAIRLWTGKQLTVGDFALIQYYLMDLFRQLWEFGRNIRRFYEYIADAQEMIRIINLPVKIVDQPNAKKLNLKYGKIEFRIVDFTYNEDQQFINNLNLKIKAGEKVALIGPSGGGKSTLTKLVLRLFDVQKGQILIDGQDISKVTQESLRRNIALVPQDPVLFHRSLMDNIRYGNPDACDKAVIMAAKKAHCDEFIRKLPQAYNTHVGERGVLLSGGERQRIAIARAILKNAKILILDEASSNLDSESEHLIQKAIAELTHNKTSVIIAHRLSTIVNVDRIIVIENGSIKEEGSHKILLQNKNSLYKQLWERQMADYLN